MTQTTVSGNLPVTPTTDRDPQGHAALATDKTPGETSPVTTRISGHLRLGYARVSTSDGRQVTDRQEDALREAGVDRMFVDHTSGIKASRPQLDALWQTARSGDTIVVLSLDRLGRDTRQLLAWVAELEQTGIHLQILQLGVDTSTPAGKMVLTVIAALSEMERAVLVGRVREGLASAKLRGRIGGRPASLSPAQRAEVVRLRADGRSAGECAELFGVSTRSIRRVTAGSITATGRDLATDSREPSAAHGIEAATSPRDLLSAGDRRGSVRDTNIDAELETASPYARILARPAGFN